MERFRSAELDQEVDTVLRAFDGDERAAIAALLEDMDALCWQIDRASLMLSHGFTRGWKPCWKRVLEAGDGA
jgi:hypothetical protein